MDLCLFVADAACHPPVNSHIWVVGEVVGEVGGEGLGVLCFDSVVEWVVREFDMAD